eukprot:Clim_evm10s1 gene=Clim_evmTU10s1
MVAEHKFVNSEATSCLSLEGFDAVDKLRKTSAFEHLVDAQKDTIPCLDLEWAFASEANKLQTAKELHAVMRDIGFLCLKNHGIDLALKNRVECNARRFFNLPDEIKERYADKQPFRGWMKRFCEVIGTGEYRDVKESYLAPVLAVDLQELWVTEIPDWQSTIHHYMDNVRRTCFKLHRLMALSLGLDEEYFNRELFSNGVGCGHELIRINYYPENLHSNADRGTFGLGEHTDFGWLTFLAFDGNPGLQIQDANGSWFSPTNVTRDMIIVNQGDFVKHLTNGKYRSTLHRVHNPEGRERISFPIFFNPNYSIVGKPIEQILEPGEEPKYEALTFGKHILGRRVSTIRKDIGKMPDLEELARGVE